MMQKELFFPRIEGTYYGGNQAWFSENRQQAGSCGVVAAANLLFYYRRENPSHEQYMLGAKSLYHWLKPLHWYNPFIPENTWGLPFFHRYMKNLEGYFQRQGILKRSVFGESGRRNRLSFLEESLLTDNPVILLIAGSPGVWKELNNHYLTLTGYDSQKQVLLASSWGQRLEVPLEQFLKSRYLRLGSFR